MGINDIVSIITTVGFPISCCVAMGYYVKYVSDKNREQVSDMAIQHKEEMSAITDALNNNTIALQKLSDKLGV